MSDVANIRETCFVMHDLGIPIDFGGEEGVILPSARDYFVNCVGLLSQASQYQKEVLHMTPSLWDSKTLRMVKDYANRKGLRVSLVPPQHPSGIESSLIGTTFSGNLMLGLAQKVPKKSETLQFILDHEWGHIGDGFIIARHFPAAGELLAGGIRTLEDKKSVIGFFMELAAQKMPLADQKQFRELGEKFFKDAPAQGDEKTWLSVYQKISELFRYGEEIGDPRLGSLFDESFLTLKKGSMESSGGKNPELQMDRGIKVARLLEAGLWEKFKQRPDFDPNTVNDLNPDHILFFRMFIRAASLYFYSPRVWQRLP